MTNTPDWRSLAYELCVREMTRRTSLPRSIYNCALKGTGNGGLYPDPLASLAELALIDDSKGWQPIETAPKGIVLLFCDASMPEHPVYYVGLVIRNRECIDTTQTIGFMATHWMQMPEPPKYIRSGNE